MKITAITPWLVRTGGSYWSELLFVQVSTDEGVTGWGEITTTTQAANRTVASALRQLNDLIVGDDPAQIEAIWHKIFRAFTYMGSRGAACNIISGVDIALWDIRGKVLGQPIYNLLGGAVRADVPLYCHPNQRNFATQEGLEQEIGEIIASGHTAFKFDPFPRRAEDDGRDSQSYLDGKLSKESEALAADLTARIRAAAGPHAELLIDAHGRFNVPTAIRLCRTLEDAGQIDWFEEPVPVESYHALSQVRGKVDASICVGERLHTRWEFVPIFEQELADYVMPDVTWTGGISEMKKIATMAEAYYVPVSPHDASGPINVVAGAQVMITVPNFYRVETARWDLSSYNALLETPLDNTGGRLHLTDAPGLGITMNVEFLRAHGVPGYAG